MEEMNTSRNSALLEQLEREIEDRQALIELMEAHPENHSILTRAAKRKELGQKIEKREVILEKRRVAEVVRKFEQEHPPEFQSCPSCRRDVIPVHDVEAGELLICCGKTICDSCWYCHAQPPPPGFVLNVTCPLCHTKILKSDQEANEAVRRLAQKGNVSAQYKTAARYQSMAEYATSEKNKRDLEQKALLWYHRAAEQGCTLAESSIARVGNDFVETMSRAEAAANHGILKMQSFLGVVYFDIIKNTEKAMYWLTLAAARGDAKSWLRLGFGFFEGWLGQNLERAKYYLETLMTLKIDDIPSSDLGKRHFVLSMVLLQLADKRYGTTPMSFVPGHNCAFKVVLLLRKSIENGYAVEDARDMLEIMENDQEFCANCQTNQGDWPPLRRCSQCKLVRYCGKACQTEHWKMGHKVECKKFCSGQM